MKKVDNIPIPCCMECGNELPLARMTEAMCSDRCLHKAMIYSERKKRKDDLRDMLESDTGIGIIDEEFDSIDMGREFGKVWSRKKNLQTV